MVDWIERHGDDPPDTSIADGSAGEAARAPSASVIQPTHSTASLEGRPVQRDNVLILDVSGNPLPLWHYANIKIGNREQTGDRRNGQAASSERAQQPEIYATANPQAPQGAPAGTQSHRWRLLPQYRRAAGPHHSALRRRPGDARPLPHDLIRAPDARGFWHYTYVTYDPDTGEWYGGKHSTKNLQDGYLGSGNWIVTHLQPERLVCEIVDFHANEEDAFAAEAILITDQTIMDDALCMNERGGGVGFTSEAATRINSNPVRRQEQSERAKQMLADPAALQNLRDGYWQWHADTSARERHAAAIKRVRSAPTSRQRTTEANKQRYTDPAERQRQSEISKQIYADPAARAKTGEAAKRAWADPAVRQQIAEAIKRAKTDPLARQRTSKTSKSMWADAAFRQKRSERLADPEVKQKMSRGMKSRWADPEYRKRCIEAQNIGRARAKAMKIDRRISIPTISELLHIAITETDFTGDLTNDQRLLETNAENSMDLAATIWEERHGYVPVPLSLIQWARCALLLEAEAMLADRAAQAEAERLDAYEAGDIDHAGNFIPYDTYRSV